MFEIMNTINQSEIKFDEVFWYLHGCIRAFLLGKQTSNWILAITRGANPVVLRYIIESINGADVARRLQLYNELKLWEVK